MSKAFKKHIGNSWRPSGEYEYAVGGKTEKMAKGKRKIKPNKEPVSESRPDQTRSEKSRNDRNMSQQRAGLRCPGLKDENSSSMKPINLCT